MSDNILIACINFLRSLLLLTVPCLYFTSCFKGGSLFSRNEVHKVAEKRRGEISDYCNRLMTLPPKVAQFPKLLDFFVLRDDDLNVPSDTK